MNRSRITVAVMIIAVILAVIILLIGKKQDNISSNSYDQNQRDQESNNVQPVKQDFTPNIPSDAKITKPEQQIIGNNNKTKAGFFKLIISSAGYEPEAIAVKKGDLMNVEITSKDNNYDIFLPGTFYYFIPRGETKTLAFETNAYPVGTYNFRCRDYCPAGKIISGSFIVMP